MVKRSWQLLLLLLKEGQLTFEEGISLVLLRTLETYMKRILRTTIVMSNMRFEPTILSAVESGEVIAQTTVLYVQSSHLLITKRFKFNSISSK